MRWALIDFRHPFFRSRVRRIVIFAVVAGWTLVEFLGGSMPWFALFLALTAYVGWGFFLSGQVDETTGGPESGDAGGSDAEGK